MKTHVWLFTLAVLLGAQVCTAQMRDYRVHARGMLHETVYNTGEIGRAYDQGTIPSSYGVPSFEWPGRSATTVDGTNYNGQYNSFGAGLYIATSRRDTVARFYSFCGGMVGEPADGKYSFPISIRKTENHQLLGNGEVNPSYNPDEADEVIVAKWTTNVGVTVTRTSRAWSNPDYDDLIIYEYELENTGITGRDGTRAFQDTLWDVLVGFAYALNPSMFGYERNFNRWDGTDFLERDLFPRFNLTRWMNYCIDRNGKPEPRYFEEWAASGTNGGGLLSPQAVGFLPLHYDYDHLARQSETQMQVAVNDVDLVFDDDGRLKQPYLNRMETGVLSYAKIKGYLDVAITRKNNPLRAAYFPYRSPYWIGRGSYNWRQSEKFGVGHVMVFGPYTLPPDAKIKFAIAEVAGYGAARLHESPQDTLWDEGGSCGEMCGEDPSNPGNAFNPVPNWARTITYGGPNENAYTHGSDYLSNHPLPEYVNSDVVTVREAADRAIELYTGYPLMKYDMRYSAYPDNASQHRPEATPPSGIYRAPVAVPSPVFAVRNTSLAENNITWGTSVESFTTPRLNAPLGHYEVYKSAHPLGPWSLLDSVGIQDPRYLQGTSYSILDRNTRVGEAAYYSVISVDTAGKRSARTQITLHQTQLGGTPTLGQVYAVPNPFIVHSGFEGVTSSGVDAGEKIGFYNLPERCTIRVFSYSGQLVQTLEHDSGFYSTEYMQLTRNNQVIAAGVYFFVVETPDGNRTHGKFVVIN